MTASELENNKILLDDARAAYNSRLSDFSNLTSKAGVLLAFEGIFISAANNWFSNPKIFFGIKAAFIILLAYAAFNCIRSMFIKNLRFFSIQGARINLDTNPTMATMEWVKSLINEYQSMLSDIHSEYDKRSNWLRDAVIVIAVAILVYSISSILGG